ncbi:MAG TPA: hypothetical protein DD619_02910 [Alphaproteobacteria bacterium]|nr:hypothetical protein [Alphaproteobacteria bacterium]
MYKNFEQGRSMIEMLGVLAIIGVLSVGGIAGYSKAMEKFKINKLIEEYNMAIFGALEHIEDFRKLTEPNGGEANSVGLKQMFVDLGLVPHTWKIGNLGPRSLIDSSNNVVGVASRNQKLLFDIYIGGVSTNDENKTISPAYSAKLCKEIFQNITKPLHSVIYVSALYKTTGGYELYYGDSFCGNNKKCLNDITVEDINKICNSCTPKDACGVAMQF